MGDYATSTDVLEIRQVAITGAASTTVDTLLNGIEARVNSALVGQKYPTVPATGPRDVAMIRQQVIQKAAAMTWLAVRGGDDLPAWVQMWHDEFESWLEALKNGEICLLDQTATQPGKRIRRATLRVLPYIPSDEDLI